MGVVRGRRAETVADPGQLLSSLPLAAGFPRRSSRPAHSDAAAKQSRGCLGGAQRSGTWESGGNRGRNLERELYAGCWPPSFQDGARGERLDMGRRHRDVVSRTPEKGRRVETLTARPPN